MDRVLAQNMLQSEFVSIFPPPYISSSFLCLLFPKEALVRFKKFFDVANLGKFCPLRFRCRKFEAPGNRPKFDLPHPRKSDTLVQAEDNTPFEAKRSGGAR